MKRLNGILTGVMIAGGIVFIAGGIFTGIQVYAQNNSPLDSTDTTVQTLDQNPNFIPLLQPVPTATPQPTGTSETLSANNQSDLPPLQVPATPVPTEAAPQIYIPDRIVIPEINLDASIESVGYKYVKINGSEYEQWLVPNKYEVGWQSTSATLGLPGNTVLNGHHNVFGKVFQNLVKLQVGDQIQVYSGTKVFTYVVQNKLLIPERFQSLEQRIINAQWIMQTTDERLTLVTCWPADSNTHRVIIVAFPLHN